MGHGPWYLDQLVPSGGEPAAVNGLKVELANRGTEVGVVRVVGRWSVQLAVLRRARRQSQAKRLIDPGTVGA